MSFQLGGSVVAPGNREIVELPLAQLPVGAKVALKVVVIHGARPGPTCFLSAAIHGDELNGIVIAREVARAVDPQLLAGTLLVVPVANPFAVIGESRYLPDRRDLNRSFPGRKEGPLAVQLAWVLTEEVLARAQFGIDLHSGSGGRNNLPQVRVDLDDRDLVDAARAFAAPAVVHTPAVKGTLRYAASMRGARVLLYEAGEAHRFGRRSIRIGVDGTLRALRHWGMLDDAPMAAGDPPLLRSRRWLRAPRSGLLQLQVSVGERVTKGQPLATIVDEVGLKEKQIKAPVDGLVIGRLNYAVAYRGDAVLHLAAP